MKSGARGRPTARVVGADLRLLPYRSPISTDVVMTERYNTISAQEACYRNFASPAVAARLRGRDTDATRGRYLRVRSAVATHAGACRTFHAHPGRPFVGRDPAILHRQPVLHLRHHARRRDHARPVHRAGVHDPRSAPGP